MLGRVRAPALILSLLVAAVTIGGCRCLDPVVNDSPGLRWWLFSNFGAERICPEMTTTGVPLRLQDRGPAVGRFFPTTCQVEINGSAQTVTVLFTGTGYAYTSLTRRVGFEASASVEYRADFFLTDDDIYVWGKVNRIVRPPDFKLGYVENPFAAGAVLTPLGHIANTFGNQIVQGELTRGFTVVQNRDTDTKTFGMGILQPPRKPHTPYDVSEDTDYTFANETVQIEWNQRDFLGPFEVVDTDQQIQMRMFLQGPAIEAIVVAKQVGDIWREQYQRESILGPPPGPVLAGTPLTPGRETRAAFRVPPGRYYVVLDHTNTAGSVAPPAGNILNPIAAGAAATVSYVAQLGEAD